MDAGCYVTWFCWSRGHSSRMCWGWCVVHCSLSVNFCEFIHTKLCALFHTGGLLYSASAFHTKWTRLLLRAQVKVGKMYHVTVDMSRDVVVVTYAGYFECYIDHVIGTRDQHSSELLCTNVYRKRVVSLSQCHSCKIEWIGCKVEYLQVRVGRLYETLNLMVSPWETKV